MDKLDRLGWAAGLTFNAYGCRIGVRVNDSDVLEQLPAYLPPEWRSDPEPAVDQLYSLIVGGPVRDSNVRRFHLLYTGPARTARTLVLDEALAQLETNVQMYVAEMARRRWFLHAGVVEWQGRAIVIPGRSHSGKSTLVAALLRAGAAYYSDEYAVLDAAGRVYPYARPLSLRQPGDKPPRKVSAATFGAAAGTGPLPVGLVVLTQYRPGRQWRPRPVSPGKSVLSLLQHAVAARRQPAAVLACLKRALRGACVLKGCRGEADVTAEALLRQAAAGPGINRGTGRKSIETASE